VACLPGIVKHSYAMPDAHQGYGFSIGGVAAFSVDDGVISPGGVGYDINCGVRLIRTDLKREDFDKRKVDLLNEVVKNVPAGLGKNAKLKFSRDELSEVMSKGVRWAFDNGYAWKNDALRIEEDGCMKSADISNVSDNAFKRGMPQIGSLGSGNHFLEIQSVDEIFDEATAKVFGFTEPGQVVVMVHSGSRGLGHQVASDYLRLMEKKYGIAGLPDRELINAPFLSDMGQQYYSAMSAAANYAWVNRQMMAHWVRESFAKVFDSDAKDLGMDIVYDVAHNIAKRETHTVDGKKMDVVVHRKGATRSFAPGRVEIPEIYRAVGQPVLIPGSMGTSSYILAGTEKAMEISFGSTAHGAGRVMSRFAAIKKFRGETVKKELEAKGISVRAASWKGISEEAPGVYKDVDEVVRVSDAAGIGKLVAKVRPMGVLKG
ncbi:MAG: RtcB family protein, partial [Candidatus Aenigmarchaeota archaeon]|nr:RtcB family protein [Candidatus Aenigmarchaeota archaeon]